MSSLKNRIGRNIVISLYYAFRLFPIKKRKIFVSNFFGKGYGDSPKYIIDYLRKHYQGYDVVWVVNDNYEFPKGIRTVNINKIWGFIMSIYEQTTSKVWVDNSHKHAYERKRKEQYYIQTWHGDIPIKKIGADIKDNSQYETEWAKHDSQMADLVISGNKWMSRKYSEVYFYDGEVALCGLPRRDILYEVNSYLIKSIKRNIGIDDMKKVILYVPTFRNEDISSNKLGAYAVDFDWCGTIESLEKKLGGSWIGLMRLHPNASKHKDELNLPSNVIDVTGYPDIMELLLISDCCISDYSSALFDFAVSKKPCFIYAPDLDKYESERGYYFNSNELPFKVASSIKELKFNIENHNEKEYMSDLFHFYNDIIHMCPEGHASEYISRIIVDICNHK